MLMFGSGKKCTLIEFETAPDLSKICPGQLAVAGNSRTRNKWCCSTNKCWTKHNNEAHERHSSFPDDKCVAIEAPADLDESSFKWIKKPNPQAEGSSSNSSGGSSGGGRG